MKIENLKTDTKGLIKLLQFLESEENIYETEVEHGTSRSNIFYLTSAVAVKGHADYGGKNLAEYHFDLHEGLEILEPTYRNRLLDLLKEIGK
ncbi:MAG: hypothetical protein ABIH65_01700 [Nanoarchaeota archaeon]